MSNASENLKAALAVSVKENAVQVAITEESRVLLADTLRHEMAVAVAEGIKQAMTKETAEAFAGVFMEQIRIQATSKVDIWAGGLVRNAVKKTLYFLFVGSIVYGFGGWTALAAFGTWLFHDIMGLK